MEDDKTRPLGVPLAQGVEGAVTQVLPVSGDAVVSDGPPDLDLAPRDEALTRTLGGSPRRRTQSTPLAGDVRPGRLVNHRFRLEYRVGQGGMGVVWAARDLRKEELGDPDSLVAIKLLPENLRTLPNALRMLQQECAKAQELAHPNIVNVHDFDREGEVVYMTMELLEGQSLSDYLRDIDPRRGEAIDRDRAFAIIADLAEGLTYAHTRGIVHLDLKPGNVFLTSDGRAKILDFGIARAFLGSGQRPAGGEGRRALTPPYASLEMLRGELPDPRDDVFALAIITYQLLSGRHPYDELPADEALREGVRPRRIPGLGERQWRGLLHGLALHREERTLTVRSFVEAVSPRRRDRRLLLLGGTAAAALAASLYFGLKPPQVVAPDLFHNPPPEVAVPAAVQARVGELLDVAEAHLLVGRLVSPPGGNALDVYRQVLELQPWNRRAIAGLRRLLDRLAGAAEAALAAGERHRAAELVDSGLEINPRDERLVALRQDITETPP